MISRKIWLLLRVISSIIDADLGVRYIVHRRPWNSLASPTETALLKKDTLMASSVGGFTAIEERLTHRLRDGMADVLKTNQD